jgi:hypothetical protein
VPHSSCRQGIVGNRGQVAQRFCQHAQTLLLVRADGAAREVSTQAFEIIGPQSTIAGLSRDKPYQTTAVTLASPSEAIARLDAGGRHLIKSPFVAEPNHLLDEGLLLLDVEAGK